MLNPETERLLTCVLIDTDNFNEIINGTGICQFHLMDVSVMSVFIFIVL